MQSRILLPARNVFEFPLRASYDAVLPVNLLVEPCSGAHETGRHSAPPFPVSPQALSVGSPQLGAFVRLEGFTVTEVDPRHHSVTLNVPPDRPPYAYRLRLQPVADGLDIEVIAHKFQFLFEWYKPFPVAH